MMFCFQITRYSSEARPIRHDGWWRNRHRSSTNSSVTWHWSFALEKSRFHTKNSNCIQSNSLFSIWIMDFYRSNKCYYVYLNGRNSSFTINLYNRNYIVKITPKIHSTDSVRDLQEISQSLLIWNLLISTTIYFRNVC